MKKILIIDDTPMLRAEVAEILRMEGFFVFEASDGAEGLTQAREHLPDLILCDIMMPKEDGIAVLRQLQSTPTTAAIPVILLSARTEDSLVQQGLALGATRFISKPFDPPSLLDAIRTQLGE